MYTVYCVKWEILIGGLLLISYAYVFQILFFSIEAGKNAVVDIYQSMPSLRKIK